MSVKNPGNSHAALRLMTDLKEVQTNPPGVRRKKKNQKPAFSKNFIFLLFLLNFLEKLKIETIHVDIEILFKIQISNQSKIVRNFENIIF